jgi:hypothetical protein
MLVGIGFAAWLIWVAVIGPAILLLVHSRT